MSTVHDETGAQVLPDRKEDRAFRDGWQARQAADADIRLKRPIWAKVAAELEVRA
ncbi:hypothetical protein QT381_02690 [Galbitalea sp. SE-J8]|uniref:hypothetical protein n=1 Tax=Galbitalea sp. SE-J8 TaxID=3054952 RepID=UPI00259CE860|nr:hypothetical protein [Galbitalea sp. SE-J8]MDM4761911.1 hypothetical protein [Galbitalea sp. SE-J8]